MTEEEKKQQIWVAFVDSTISRNPHVIGKRISERRLELNLTEKQAAELCGLEVNLYETIEDGQFAIVECHPILTAISQGLGIYKNYLLNGEEQGTGRYFNSVKYQCEECGFEKIYLIKDARVWAMIESTCPQCSSKFYGFKE